MKRITFALSIFAFGFALSALTSNASAEARLSLAQSAGAGASSIVLSGPVKPGTQLVISGSNALTTEVVTAGAGSNAIVTSITPPLRYAHQAGSPVGAN
jgi:hypothetical protein